MNSFLCKVDKVLITSIRVTIIYPMLTMRKIIKSGISALGNYAVSVSIARRQNRIQGPV